MNRNSRRSVHPPVPREQRNLAPVEEPTPDFDVPEKPSSDLNVRNRPHTADGILVTRISGSVADRTRTAKKRNKRAAGFVSCRPLGEVHPAKHRDDKGG
jgi:hypothetical protein